jgi:hypothetical protein
MASLRKNVASQNFTICLVNSTNGAPLTGATVSVNVTKDNGAQASGGGTVTEAGNGQYNYAPTQAETNATDVGFVFTATNAVPVNVDFHPDFTDAAGLQQVDVTSINGSATGGAQLGQSTQTIVTGTVGSGSTTTAVVCASIVNPTSLNAAGQLIGRTLIFEGNTTTAALQGQAMTITASTTGSTPTISTSAPGALTTAPSAGDTFSVL